MTFIMTRIDVGDYDAWKPMFDRDAPRARERLLASRVLDRFADKSGPTVVEPAELLGH